MANCPCVSDRPYKIRTQMFGFFMPVTCRLACVLLALNCTIVLGGLDIYIKKYGPYPSRTWHRPRLEGGLFPASTDITNYAIIYSLRRYALNRRIMLKETWDPLLPTRYAKAGCPYLWQKFREVNRGVRQVPQKTPLFFSPQEFQ